MKNIDKMKIQQQNEMKIKNKNEEQQQLTSQKPFWKFSQAKYHRWEFLI